MLSVDVNVTRGDGVTQLDVWYHSRDAAVVDHHTTHRIYEVEPRTLALVVRNLVALAFGDLEPPATFIELVEYVEASI